MSEKTYYFISGLPRSGSTLLSAILKQNPNFYADISSPLSSMLSSMIGHLSTTEQSPNIDANQRSSVLRGIVDGYYKHINNNVIFDSSRGWTQYTSLIKTLYPNTKIICCVRDIIWILDSFEKHSNANPLYLNNLIEEEARHCVTTRADFLMDVQKAGTVVKPWFWLKEGLLANPDMILLVEYDQLTKYPKQTMKRIYDFIEQPEFEHDFENVVYSNEPFDLSISSPGLHTVMKRVEYRERISILPEETIKKYSNMEFWRSKLKEFKYS
jgi:sulfotransferase